MRRLAVPAAALVAAVLLAACGSSSSSSSSSTAASAGAAPSLTASEKEFSITLSSSTVPAGTVSIAASNAGQASHNLAIEGNGISEQQTPTIGPGASATLTVKLPAGTYTLFCAIPGHRAAGMQTTLTVQ